MNSGTLDATAAARRLVAAISVTQMEHTLFLAAGEREAGKLRRTQDRPVEATRAAGKNEALGSPAAHLPGAARSKS